MKAQANKESPGRGRKPLSEFEKAKRRAVKCYSDLVQTEAEFDLMLSVEKPANQSARDKEVLSIARKRIKLSEELNVLLAGLYHDLRDKTLSKAARADLEVRKARRDELFAALKEMPEIGMTQHEWDSLPAQMRSKDIGRPKVSMELRLIRARVALAEAEAELRAIEKAEGLEPVVLKKFIKEAKTMGGDAGRPNGGVITELERKIRLLDDKIRTIETGEAARVAKEGTKRQMVTARGKRRGRPFESPADRLKRYLKAREEMTGQIAEIERRLPPLELIQRRITLKRREIAAQNEILAQMNLDPDFDSGETEVQTLYRLETELYGLEDERARLKAQAAHTGESSASAQAHNGAARASDEGAVHDIKSSAMKLQAAKLNLQKVAAKKRMEAGKKAKESGKVSATEKARLKNLLG